MTVSSVCSLFRDSVWIEIIDVNSEKIVSYYDGRNSIDEKFMNYEVLFVEPYWNIKTIEIYIDCGVEK